MRTLLDKPIENLSNEELVTLVEHLNTTYRSGAELVRDEVFENYLSALKERVPDHDFFLFPQPEPVSAKGRVPHGKHRMLSTQKAYKVGEVQSWVTKCLRYAESVGVDSDDLVFRMTPKLDGLAGRYASGKVITRGDKDFGNDITHLLHKGMVIKGVAGDHSVGEIVVDEEYYQSFLADEYLHPRNFVSGVATADELSASAEQALQDGAIHFVLYKDMPGAHVFGKDLMAMQDIDELVERVTASCPYRNDGVVIEIVNDVVKQEMGSTSSFHNWQLAIKVVGENAIATVKDLAWQTSRTGRVNPVIEIEDTPLDGCTIRRLTGHHCFFVVKNSIGKGAKIKIVRSGGVIPTFVETVEPVIPTYPSHCPSCGSLLEKEDDYIVCRSSTCDAQLISQLEHHFKQIQADLFGPKTIEKLIAAEFKSLEKIYIMTEQDFCQAGFGAKQAQNLVDELMRVKREPLREYLLLASLGIRALGRGASKKLLSTYSIEEVLSLTPEQIKLLEGFGSQTAAYIVEELLHKASTLKFLIGHGFNLTRTKQEHIAGPLTGETIVFTGKMSLSRDEMEQNARLAGATVLSAISSKVTMLVCGESVGETKRVKAQKLGVKIITEQDYRQLLAPDA